MKPGPKPRARTTPTQKHCPSCDRTREADQFWHATKSHDGLQAWCKACAATYNAKLMRKRRQKSEAA